MAGSSNSPVVSTANLLLECARRHPHLLRDETLHKEFGISAAQREGEECGSKWKSIHDKLIDLYIEYRARASAEAAGKDDEEDHEEEGEGTLKGKSVEEKTSDSEPNLPANLLGLLVDRESLNTLVLKLYPGNDGYALMLKGLNGNPDTETMRLPYEEEDFLHFVDNQQLPPVLSELLQQCHENFFYSGCVILEVHDFRRFPADALAPDVAVDLPYALDYVLLRPSNLNLVCGINGYIAASGPGDPNSRWTQEERDSLESQLLLATSDPLCLNPDPAVGIVFNKLHFQRQKLNRSCLRKAARRFGVVARNRRRRFDALAPPKELFLHDFLAQRPKRRRDGGDDSTSTSTTASVASAVNLRISKSKSVDAWRRKSVKLEPPKVGVDKVFELAKALPPELPSTTNALPVTVEEFILETERQTGKVNYTRVVIQQRPTDQMYVGELYVDRDFEDGKLKGSSCKFNLGTKTAVEKYIQQFTEIVTEEGRRPVKITHVVPGQAAKICSTQGLTQSNNNNNAKSNRRQSTSSSASSSAASSLGATPSTSGGGASIADDRKSANQLKINLPGGVTATANVQLVGAQGGATSGGSATAPNNVAIVQSDSAGYQLISSDDESTSGISAGVPVVSQSQTSSVGIQPITANIAGLHSLLPGTQLQFQTVTQQQQPTPPQQHQQTTFANLKTTPNRSGTTRQGIQQVFTTTSGNIIHANNTNIFQNLSHLQQQQQQSQQQIQTTQPIQTNVLTSPGGLQIQQRGTTTLQSQQHQTFNRRTSGGVLRNGVAQQLRFHQPGNEVSGSGSSIIQIHPNSTQSGGGANIIQIHGGQILKSSTSSSAGIIGGQTDVKSGTIPPAGATATIIPAAAAAAQGQQNTINLANIQQIQIPAQPAANINLNAITSNGGGNLNLNSIPTQLQMSIGGVSVPVSLALSQSVSNNPNSGGGLQVSTASVPASIALALGSLAQNQTISAAPSSTAATKFLTAGTSGQVFVTSNALQHSGAAIQAVSGAGNLQLQQHQQTQPTQQLVMAATGPFLQINAAGPQSGIKGASTQIRTKQIPLLQTVGVQQQPQQNILMGNQKTVTIQQPQFRQQQIQQQQQLQQLNQPGQEQRTTIQIQNPTSGAVPQFRII